MKINQLIQLSCFALPLALAACGPDKEETPAEKTEDAVENAGEKVDEATEEVGDEIDDATDDN